MSTRKQDPGHDVTGVFLWTIDGHERTAAAPSTFRAAPGPEKGAFLARNEPCGVSVNGGSTIGVMRPSLCPMMAPAPGKSSAATR